MATATATAAGPIKSTAFQKANVTVACLEQNLELGLPMDFA